jgi:hypothetical protein
MMMRATAVLLMATCVATSAFSEDPVVSRVQDGQTSVESKIRQVFIPEVGKNSAGGSHVCRFHYTDPMPGYLSDEEHLAWARSHILDDASPEFSKLDEYRLSKLPFRAICTNSDAKTVRRAWMKYDNATKQWRVNLTAADARLLRNAPAKTFQLKSKNAEGWAVAISDVVEQGNRVYRLHYCLIHAPVAVCGFSDVGADFDDPASSRLLDFAVGVLDSITFLDGQAEGSQAIGP